MPVFLKEKRAALPTVIEVNCDADPKCPDGLHLDRGGVEHKRMGIVRLERRGDQLYADGRPISRYRSHKQRHGGTAGDKLRQELASKLTPNACILDALLANQHLIPDDWKEGSTYFWSTRFGNVVGESSYVFVECLFHHDGRYYADYKALNVEDWDENDFAAVLGNES
jgi:hypothetical protein